MCVFVLSVSHLEAHVTFHYLSDLPCFSSAASAMRTSSFRLTWSSTGLSFNPYTFQPPPGPGSYGLLCTSERRGPWWYRCDPGRMAGSSLWWVVIVRFSTFLWWISFGILSFNFLNLFLSLRTFRVPAPTIWLMVDTAFSFCHAVYTCIQNNSVSRLQPPCPGWATRLLSL